jgi:hypothetical protein
MDDVIAAVANGTGVVVLIVGLFWMLATGKLVTRREADGIAADRDMWRETAQTLTLDMPKLLTEAETTNRLLRSLPRISEVDQP